MPQQRGNTTTDEDNNVHSAIQEVNREFKEREIQQRAREQGIPYIDLSILPINDDMLRIISEEESLEGDIIPFFQVGKKLRIAILDPENINTKRIIKSLEEQGYILNINLCSEGSLVYAQQFYKKLKKQDTSVEELNEQVLKRAKNISQEIQDLSELPSQFAEIKSDLALAILNRKAISTNASDIHLEGEKNGVRVRGRIDGTLRNFFILSNKIAAGIIRQIKFNAHIASNAPDIPADGQFIFPVEGREIMVRVSVLPEKHGESIVLRYLDPKKQDLQLEELGFSEFHQQEISQLLSYREGLILSTGPTGSGKTTTLYAMLKNINTPDKKIITLENPVEYEVEGIIQSSIKNEKGFSFSEGLKSCLRQDPDVILVGEIRDTQTAETALQASMTGHLVLSTLHTNSAIETIVRLRDLNIPNYLTSNSLKGVLAQRLLRKPCPHCKEKQNLTAEQMLLLKKILAPHVKNKEDIENIPTQQISGKGCKKCGNTGYKGRTVVSEIIIVSEVLSEMIAKNQSYSEIITYLINTKHRFLSYDAAIKILKGKTDINEAIRVLGKNFLPTETTQLKIDE